MGSLRVRTTQWLHFHFSLSCTGEGNGNPLQCSCLENPRDGEAWWAAVCGVAQSQTRLSSSSSSSNGRECIKSTWIIFLFLLSNFWPNILLLSLAIWQAASFYIILETRDLYKLSHLILMIMIIIIFLMINIEHSLDCRFLRAETISILFTTFIQCCSVWLIK